MKETQEVLLTVPPNPALAQQPDRNDCVNMGPQRMEQTLAEFIVVQMEDLQSLFIVVCIITLPVTATIYYVRSIIKAV